MTDQSVSQKRNIGHRILHSAIVKIIIGFLLVAGVASIYQLILEDVLESSSLQSDHKDLIVGIGVAIISIAIYILLYKIYESRKITELSSRRLIRNLSLGLLLGFGLQTLTIAVIYISGSYEILAFNSFAFLFPSLTMAITASVFEEILFRGILFRLIEEKLGSYLALVISAIVFGGLHYFNPNSSFLAAAGLAIQAGVLLGAVYIYSKNLWLPIALHFAWNFTQSGIYGASTSGNEISKSLITSRIDGSTLITGASFGPEGSIQATLFCLSAAIIILIICKKQNKIVPPSWVKKGEYQNIIPDIGKSP